MLGLNIIGRRSAPCGFRSGSMLKGFIKGLKSPAAFDTGVERGPALLTGLRFRAFWRCCCRCFANCVCLHVAHARSRPRSAKALLYA